MSILEPVEPQPPAAHIRHAGHHWLQQRSMDGNTFSTVVLQWNPVQNKWFQSGSIGSCDPPIRTTYWKYLAPCPLPPV
jgi:hypothetical protein